jgi:hypothetical protein
MHGVGGWLLLYHEPLLSAALNFLCLIALMIVTWLIVRKPVEIYCAVEIKPDSYGQKIETAQRRQRSNIFGLVSVLHNKLAVDA